MPPTHSTAPVRRARIGPLDAVVERRADGSALVRSPHPLGGYATRLTDRLEHWAAHAPDRTFLAQRGPDGAAYARALRSVVPPHVEIVVGESADPSTALGMTGEVQISRLRSG
jgi:hypothetical protein